ncbi:MAG TPA: hypothetical protein VK631_08465 [Solirubrobacteraceae bacterium]|nr:hypothetical protein [Solirubrobacteraceae bacterium]
MHDPLYPLELSFPSSAGPITFVIDRTGWEFHTGHDRTLYHSLPIDERVHLRRGVEAQVELAKQTPKGDT